MTVAAVAFIARSGTGKTTLLERLLPILAGRGYRVGAIKHDAHRFDIDRPGKDSHRLTAAGAATVLITSSEKLALVKNHPQSPPAEELIDRYFRDMDLVLVEGFRKSALPKIELCRKEMNAPLICRGEFDDPALLAVVSDAPLAVDVPLLDLNAPDQVADFIEERILKGAAPPGPISRPLK
ncbi:MAG: molybdopterin-guanine dinucleotide biosynthesis protein B [Deltaproteobacteria bacterium]|nr:molybdopterin-guanine dinucleotide biosynthesis protein B [Deltaproteobacteria bacterium]